MERNNLINCKNGSFTINDVALSFLRFYKSVANKEDFKNIFNKNALGSPLGYKNINLFMNFLANPNDEMLQLLDVDYVDKIIESIKTFIDISCEYALNDGEIDCLLYRYEDKRNIEGYQQGMLTSTKSTSNKPYTTKFTFETDNTVPLVIKAPSFCPHIRLDEIIKDGYFSNEAEYLLPPYVGCILTDEYEYNRHVNDSYRVVRIIDEYLDANPEHLEKAFNDYQLLKNSITSLFLQAKKEGIVSKELKDASSIINEYLKEYARCKYKKYYELYKNKYHQNSQSKNNLKDIHQGLQEAITKYCTNNDLNKNWIASGDYNVYALEYLIDSQFITIEEVFELHKRNDYEALDNFFKQRKDTSKYASLSEEEYSEFLKYFNISAGYGNDDYKPTKEEIIGATNYLACLEFIQETQDYHR